MSLLVVAPAHMSNAPGFRTPGSPLTPKWEETLHSGTLLGKTGLAFAEARQEKNRKKGETLWSGRDQVPTIPTQKEIFPELPLTSR